jgi:protein-disulfide isomerase
MTADPPRARETLTRRALVMASLVALPGGWALWKRMGPVRTEPIVTPPGFRGLVGQSASRLDPLFLGLEPSTAAQAPVLNRPGRPRVAIFTDALCPYCRHMERALDQIVSHHSEVSLTFHDWPRLAPASHTIARAILAAAEQGAEDALRSRLSDLVARPEAHAIRALANSMGLDGAKLLAGMDGPRVSARLASAEGLAASFRVGGTPVIVVEGTVIRGAVSKRLLDRVLRDATRETSGPCT